MRLRLLLITTSVLACALVSSAAAQTIYETSFEATDVSGANYTLGDLDGQGAADSFAGWQVAAGTAQVVAGPGGLGAKDGANSVHQDANSTIVAEAASSSNRVIIRAWHNGAGTSQALQAPDVSTMAAAILGFESTGASTYVVKAFDGPGDTGSYIAPANPVQLSTSAWNKIVVSVNYDTQTFDVAVNNAPYLQGLHFFNSEVTSFNGFQASSQASANIDLVGFFASDGDYDNDGVGDDTEMHHGTDPLDPSSKGAGDVNQDTIVNLVDALLYGRQINGQIDDDQLIIQDLTGDSLADMDDAGKIFNYATGAEAFVK